MKRLLLCSAALLLLCRASPAWDYTGHMLVDQIAYQNVSPRVRERVVQMVSTLENKYNEHQPYNFVTAGAWMDDMRSMPNYPWGPLHYLDVPYTAAAIPFVTGDEPSVLTGIRDSVAVLKNAKASAEEQSRAVAMILHFVGDIHQPLHCVNWDDKGGNGYFIYGIPFSDLFKKSVPNLHAFWDKAFRFDVQDDKIVELYHGPLPAERPTSMDSGLLHDEAAKIMEKFPKSAVGELKPDETREWARESYTIACLFSYPVRPHPTDAEVVALTPAYVHQSHEVACERVALAGYRLAAMLENLFGQ